MTKMILTGIICAIVFYGIGWISAHNTVEMECKRLGKFYVGNETFVCQKENQ